jgi:hypothetical protein
MITAENARWYTLLRRYALAHREILAAARRTDEGALTIEEVQTRMTDWAIARGCELEREVQQVIQSVAEPLPPMKHSERVTMEEILAMREGLRD